jgi:poly(A) polymerase
MTEAHLKWPRVTGDWLESPALAEVFAALGAGGAEVRVVGGAVRNALIDRPVKEIDLATTALPDDVIRLAQSAGLAAYPTGIEHGTITVVADKHSFEVTTLRKDVETDGRHAIVSFTNSWEEDAARRDFTINALSCTPDGTIYDSVGGLDDVRQRRVRFIGDAEARIREDYLRILRFFRFSAEYGRGVIDPAGLTASVALKDGMALLSAERIRAETLKLLAAPYALDVVNAMYKSGILELVVRTVLQPDRLARLIAIEATLGEPADALTRLAALGVSHPDDAAFLTTQLRLSNAEASRLTAASRPDARFDPATSEAAARAALYDLGVDTFSRSVRLEWARSDAPTNDPRWRARVLLPDRWKAPSMPVSGGDVVALGVPPGPKIGMVLKDFEHWWVSENFPTDAERQSNMLKDLARKALS